MEDLGPFGYQNEGEQHAAKDGSKIVESRGSATRIHLRTEERHCECQLFLHQQVCLPNDGEQTRLLHHNKSL